ncbi:NAD(P)/FAD-dependent oxidoreductase [Nocardioides terrisoli]|uniref:NAD(P)/FAD-dependent oxidoreductase n=1 Tax=Nocardioides terrisoli TaxID=3388267 RepID=UPI00287B63EE|nr:FAD-dependent oxidoreductase [Nocardioides marmorisolisilvae]
MSDPIVLVGGGLAAGTAATELRAGGYDGPVLLFTEESHLPYERPPLSKSYLMGKDPADKAAVHDQAWYDEHDVEVRTGTHVDSVDPTRKVVVAGGTETPYAGLLLATGAAPRHLPLADDSGVRPTYLRTLDDSTALREHLQPGRRIGIIGGGWIGLEVASAAREAGAEVVVLEALEQPLLRVLGPEVAAIFADLHREHGVDLRTGVQVTGIANRGDGARIALGDDSVDVDHLVVGVGVAPNTALAEAAGLSIDNGIRVDAGLRTSAPGIWAAGDVANADHPGLGYPLRVEHWDTAIQHGKVAAANLAGGSATAEALPYFFTDQYDLGMEYVGNPGPEGFDRVVLEGDVPGRVFRAWWVRGDRVVAGMHVNDWDAIDDVRARVGQPL